jgi:abortive infection bacteriophage resistance protein
MDAIERVEVFVRTQLAYDHWHKYGCFAYATYATDAKSMPNAADYAAFQSTLQQEYSRSRDTFCEHFDGKYGDDHQCLPVQMAVEIMSFGTTLTFFRGSSQEIKQGVASRFNTAFRVFENWLLCLNTVRNICAHHSRFWDRTFGLKPMIPRHRREWHHPVAVTNEQVFGMLTMCRYCLSVAAPQSSWGEKMRSLVTTSPEAVPIKSMGFPENWQDCPIWK